MVKHAIVIVGFLAIPAFGVIIDDFSVGPITLTADFNNRSPYGLQTGLDLDAIIGGRRYIGLGLNSPVLEDYLVVATVDTATQTFHLDVDGEMEIWAMEWGAGVFSYPDFALNADLLSDGADAFRIDVAANLLPTTQPLSAGSGANEGTWDADAWGVFFPASDTPYSIRVPFSRFPNVDFRDIDYVGFGRSVQRGTDLTLDGIRTVPEPATVAIFILGLMGIMWMRWWCL